MVLKYHLRARTGISSLVFGLIAFFSGLLNPASSLAEDEVFPASTLMKEVQSLYQSGKYFMAAREAFSLVQQSPQYEAEAYSWITLSLMQEDLPNAASFFFLRTLQSGNRQAIRRVLTQSTELIYDLGPDLIRKFLIRYTSLEDFTGIHKSAMAYALAKEALLQGKEERAISYINQVSLNSPFWVLALQIRATAHAILRKNNLALIDFQQCTARATELVDKARSRSQTGGSRSFRARREMKLAQDLANRCVAGEARTLYQVDRFQEADRVYDRIPKSSFVWTDILFEQAWNAFAKKEYNKALGKLVTYKNPSLRFVYNTEIDVLRAQTYLALCLYGEANQVINEFHEKYARVGTEVKQFVEMNTGRYDLFFQAGKNALKAPLHTGNEFAKMLNRFVRSPYFVNLVQSEGDLATERQMVRSLGTQNTQNQQSKEGALRGLPIFLDQVLSWREKAIQRLAGVFVKNSILDYHQTLISDFEKMSFIKLEMLSRAKEALMRPEGRSSKIDRSWGNVVPRRRDDQYYWNFNGEFWSDELGDYVFGLESECARAPY